MSNSLIEVPVIDWSLFVSGDTETRNTVVSQIYQACHEIGFMYLKHPGIPSSWKAYSPKPYPATSPLSAIKPITQTWTSTGG